MSGPDSGKTGQVIRVIRRKNVCVVEGANIVRRFQIAFTKNTSPWPLYSRFLT